MTQHATGVSGLPGRTAIQSLNSNQAIPTGTISAGCTTPFKIRIHEAALREQQGALQISCLDVLLVLTLVTLVGVYCCCWHGVLRWVVLLPALVTSDAVPLLLALVLSVGVLLLLAIKLVRLGIRTHTNTLDTRT